MIALACHDLKVRRGSGFELQVPALEVEPGTVVAVQGANGSGKSTLLLACAGLLELNGGRVEIEGECHRGAAPASVAYRRRVVLVHQEPYLFRGTVRRNLSWGQRLRRVPRDERRRHGQAVLTALGLDDFSECDVERLSGGQRTLVAVARALVLQSELLLLDEVTRDLDPRHKHAVMEGIRARSKDGATVMLATHDPEILETLAHRRVELANGAILGLGA